MFKKVILITIAAAAYVYSQIPYTFTADSTASALQVNANFTYLLTQVNSLKDRCDSIAILKAQCDNLSRNIVSLRLKVDSLAIADAPLGTVIASVFGPAADGFLPNSNQSWVLAGGQAPVNGVTVPDLRGAFLRGIDYTLTGRPATGRDSSVTRTAGSYQADAMQRHVHQAKGINGSPVNSYSGLGTYTVAFGNGLQNTSEASARVATETRPKNVAVYYYIKVK